jgi:ATP-dependent DNA helicase RecG
MGYLNLSSPLAEIKVISPRYQKLLGNLGLKSAGDLLYHLPVRYEDFSAISAIADVDAGQHVTVSGIIENVAAKHTWKKRMSITEATITDESGSIKAVWFNQPYLLNSLKTGRRANFSGKVAANEREIYLSHPTWESVANRPEPTDATIHTGRLVPVYPETRGLTSRGLRTFIQIILERLEPVPEWIPGEILKLHNFPAIADAIRNVHFPASLDEATQAKKRFAFEDLFLLQLYNTEKRAALAREKAPAIRVSEAELGALLNSLPFDLTQSQKTSLSDILQDLKKGRPMNRLLQGDVGSGKTIVAVIAALAAARSGYQTAFMAPTEILARQHFESVKKVLSAVAKDNIPHYKNTAVAFMAGAGQAMWWGDNLEADHTKTRMSEIVRNGEASIIVGTHAIIQKSVEFKNLGLLIVDEQHRFGVRQRAELLKRKRKSGEESPHFLSMSATPIPRTFMLTIFGDLDLSLINELPAGRRPIITKVVAPENRVKAYGFIKGQVKKGRQVFVVCPRIEPPSGDSVSGTNTDKIFSGEKPRRSATGNRMTSLGWEVKTVKQEFEKLSKRIFPEFAVAMLHGKLKAAVKESVMRGFKDGKADILVSTSVIEVGVDVPNATIMMIEGADRFGLAQLYQFRGRVGRGEHQSFCFLFTDSPYKTTAERLKAVVDAKNGFELAETDLKIRGPGEFLGNNQTGLPDIAMRGLQDADLIRAARDAALIVFQNNRTPGDYPLLNAKIAAFRKMIHLE